MTHKSIGLNFYRVTSILASFHIYALIHAIFTQPIGQKMLVRQLSHEEKLIQRLHIAAADPNGFPEVRVLIEREKVDVDALHPDYKLSAFDFAAMGGSFETLEYLKEVANANLDATNKVANPLYLAIRHRSNNQNSQKILLYIASFAEEFKDNTTKFHIATLICNLNNLKAYAKECPNEGVMPDAKGHTPFYYAVKLADSHKMKFLVEFPANAERLADLEATLLIKTKFESFSNKTCEDDFFLANITLDYANSLARVGRLAESLPHFNKVSQICSRLLAIIEARSNLPQTYFCPQKNVKDLLLTTLDSRKKVEAALNQNSLFAPPKSTARRSRPNNSIYSTYFDIGFIARSKK